MSTRDDLVKRLRDAYEKVKLWPENRMKPDAVLELGQGFIDLLDLRNLSEEAADTITQQAAEIERLKAMVDAWSDYPTISGKLHDRERAREAEQKTCRAAVDRAETAESNLADALAALEPFANQYVGGNFPEGTRTLLSLKIGDLRTARDTYTRLSAQESAQ